MDNCHVDKCTETVSKEGYKLCYKHWKEQNKDDKPKAPAKKGKTLTATTIAKELGLTSRKVNQILAELGWIEKTGKGFIPTRQGQNNGAHEKEHFQSGAAYVVWDSSIIENKIFINSVKEFSGEEIEPEPVKDKKSHDKATAFRKAFPAEKRAKDGHMVRSRGEVLIDNYLYAEKIVHAYEKRLPLADEECFCDFYIPDGNIYIEYWGLEESNTKYAERKKIKQEIYKREKLDLIEITNDMIDNLDDVLSKELKKRGFDVS